MLHRGRQISRRAARLVPGRRRRQSSSYKIDVPIKREADKMDNGRDAPTPFKAPQPQLFAIIIEGILGGKLEWSLVMAGALIAVTMELMGIGALPVAVGMYLGLSTATPIFIGGILRWLTDRRAAFRRPRPRRRRAPACLLRQRLHRRRHAVRLALWVPRHGRICQIHGLAG